nr:hypothetical protein BDOA9_0200760 [Bradyrhizobium sp. DOA9]
MDARTARLQASEPVKCRLSPGCQTTRIGVSPSSSVAASQPKALAMRGQAMGHLHATKSDGPP